METIQLNYPVEAHGVTIDSLKMRRPKVGDLLRADKGKGSEAEKEIRMFANLTEQNPELVESLDLADYQKLQSAYKDFLS